MLPLEVGRLRQATRLRSVLRRAAALRAARRRGLRQPGYSLVFSGKGLRRYIVLFTGAFHFSRQPLGPNCQCAIMGDTVRVTLELKREDMLLMSSDFTFSWTPPEFAGWAKPRQAAWEALPTAPDEYYLNYLPPGENAASGEWSADENAHLRHVLREHPEKVSSSAWGLFSLQIPGRTGAQCRTQSESLKKSEGSQKVQTSTPTSARGLPRSNPRAGAGSSSRKPGEPPSVATKQLTVPPPACIPLPK